MSRPPFAAPGGALVFASWPFDGLDDPLTTGEEHHDSENDGPEQPCPKNHGNRNTNADRYSGFGCRHLTSSLEGTEKPHRHQDVKGPKDNRDDPSEDAAFPTFDLQSPHTGPPRRIHDLTAPRARASKR